MTFSEIYSSNNKVLSLEFFPPKTMEGLASTREQIRCLSTCKPNFMTITYGAGGGTKEFTRSLLEFVHKDIKAVAVSHLTCVGHSIEEIDQILDSLSELGIKHILALRGDTPNNSSNHLASRFTPHPKGFNNARELTNYIARLGKFSLAVAGYPETHPDAESTQADIEYLKTKIDAGAEVVLTQLFFDCSAYFRFRERAESVGISVPLVPGIMPISNVSQIKKFTKMCGASIPDKVLNKLASFEDDNDAIQKFGIEYALSQCNELLKQGAPGIHLYTLNRSSQAMPILRQLSLN